MGSSSLLLHFACLLAPVQHDGSAINDQSKQERAPVILHVAREVPQLKAVEPIRSTESSQGSGIKQTTINRPVHDPASEEGSEEPLSGGLSLNSAAGHRAASAPVDTVKRPVFAWHGAADDTKRPPRPMTTESNAIKSAASNSATTISSAKTPNSLEVEVPEVLRVRPRETAQPAPAATPTRESSVRVSPSQEVPEQEMPSQGIRSSLHDRPSATPTHTTARSNPSAETQRLTPPRRLFDTSPIGSGVRRISPQQSNDDRWAGADQYRVQPGTSGTPNTGSAARSRPSQNRDQIETAASPLQVMMAGPGSFAVGQTEDFQVVITNHSDEVIDEALVQLTPASGFRVSVLDRAAAMDQASGIVQWRVENLAPGSQEVIRFKASASRPGRLVHTLQIVDREGNQSVARVSTVAVVARRGR